MYVILKFIETRTNNKKIVLPVIMLDSLGEVLEYNNIDDAQNMVNILNNNTDSGHKYEVKKI